MTAAHLVEQQFEYWRESARSCLSQQLAPQEIAWSDDGRASPIFGPPVETCGAPSSVHVPRRFMALASSVACHRDDRRWSLLYDLLWRLTHGQRHLLAVASDPLVGKVVQMHRAVRRSAHKMKAFVRFRALSSDPVGEAEFVAWFEPDHRVMELTAPFFVERFSSMRWTICTPDACARWDGERLVIGAGVERHLAPDSRDSLEDLWRTYYAGTFNPARLNRTAMRAEMPLRYWKNLPEAILIGELSREAPARVAAMVAQSLEPPGPMPAECESPAPTRVSIVRPEDCWHPVHDPGWRAARRRAEAVELRAPAGMRCGATWIAAGVAGWTDPTLLADGVFYPAEARTPEERLRFYAAELPMVEVDSTYYALPSEETSRRWVERTPAHFVFNVKAHALMTGHPTDPARLPPWLRDELPQRLRLSANVYSHHFTRDALDEVWSRFLSAIEPLRNAGRLGAIMLQYPRWFTPVRKSAAALSLARERLGDWPASVEFRHRDWLSGATRSRTFQVLKSLAFSYVAVDSPPGMVSSVPPFHEVTNPELAMFRFHGRREATWEARNDEVAERYRYLYDEEQLISWLPAIERAIDQSMRVHLVFNNNKWNYAVANALEMTSLVAGSLPGPGSVGFRHLAPSVP